MKTKKAKTAIVVVDMQDVFLRELNARVRSELINNQSRLFDLAFKKHIPVIVLEYGKNGLTRGQTIKQIREGAHNQILFTIIKNSNSGFKETDLDLRLKAHNINKLIVVGVNANGCVQDTVIGALRGNYEVLTAKGLIANSYTNDMSLSPRNEAWYKRKVRFFDSTEELFASIS